MLIIFSCMSANAVPRIKVIQGTCDDAKAISSIISTEKNVIKSRLKAGHENIPLNTVLHAQLEGMQKLQDTITNWAKFNCPSI